MEGEHIDCLAIRSQYLELLGERRQGVHCPLKNVYSADCPVTRAHSIYLHKEALTVVTVDKMDLSFTATTISRPQIPQYKCREVCINESIKLVHKCSNATANGGPNLSILLREERSKLMCGFIWPTTCWELLGSWNL